MNKSGVKAALLGILDHCVDLVEHFFLEPNVAAPIAAVVEAAAKVGEDALASKVGVTIPAPVTAPAAEPEKL